MKQGERWIIFYTDGSTFCSIDGTPWDAPRRSVQHIASYKVLNDWYNVKGFDYYYWEEENGGWNEARDLFTVMDHLLREKYPCILFGRMLSDENWKIKHSAALKYCNEHAAFIVGSTDERPPQNYL